MKTGKSGKKGKKGKETPYGFSSLTEYRINIDARSRRHNIDVETVS